MAGLKQPDFPKWRLATILACYLVEPLAMTSIVPYAFSMVKSIKPTASDAEIARTLTLIFSSYSFAQFGTNLLWGRISDRIGRRPVILLGLASTCLNMLGFAFSRSIAAMFAFRILAGLLSGNIVIIRTVIGEIVRGRENKARAFVWNQTVYQAGSVLGPLIGGYLAQPCQRFSGFCSAGSLLDAYPFALPNLVLCTVTAMSFITGFFFIQESLARPASQKGANEDDEETALLISEQELGSNPSFRDAINSKVIHVVVSYGLMALHTICFDQIFPVFMSTPHAASHPPFFLNGGLGFGSSLVASLMSATGIVFVGLMLTVFPLFDSRFGSVRCLRGSLVLYPFTYFIIPYLALLPGLPSSTPVVAASAILLSKSLAAIFSFNETAVLLSMAAPSHNTLGLVNGVGQTAAAGARAVGPAVMGFFIGIGDRIGSEAALGWWFLAAIAALGTVQGFWVVDEPDEIEETNEDGETAVTS